MDSDFFTEEFIANITEISDGEEDLNDDGYVYGPPVVMGIISFFGILFNAIAITVNCVLEDYKKTSHWYVLNLAIADGVFLCMLPMALAEHLLGEWKLGEGVCKAYNSVFFINYYAGIFFLTVMSFDRYLAILHPMSSTWRKLRSKEGCRALTLFVWILAIATAMPLIVKTRLVPRAENVPEAKLHCALKFDSADSKQDRCARAGIPWNRCDQFAEMHDRLVESDTQSPQQEDDFPFDPQESSAADRKYDIPDAYMFDIGLANGSQEISDTKEQTDDPTYPSWLDTETLDTDPYCNHPPFRSLKAWIYSNFVLTFLIPIFVMIFCYGCILWRILHPRIPSSKTTYGKGSSASFLKKGSTSSTKGTAQKTNHRVTILVVTLVATFIICWTPYHAQHLAKITGMALSTTKCKHLTTASYLLAYCNSLLNPLLYTFLGANFHKRASKVWKRIRSRNSGTVEFFGSLKRSKSSERYPTRTSVTSRITKNTESMTASGHNNISMSMMSTNQKIEQSCTERHAV